MRVLLIDTNSVRAGEQAKAAALAGLGLEVTLLTPAKFVENYQTLKAFRPIAPPYRLETAPMLGKPPNRSLLASGLRRTMTPEPDAVLVLSDENFWLTAQALAWQKLYCPRALFLCHSWQNLDFNRLHYPQPSRFLYALDTWLERRVFKSAAVIMARNREAMGVLRRRGYQGRLAYIPWAVAVEDYKPGERTSDRPYTIGYVGRFIREKGIGDLLEASRLMKAGHRLLLVGGGPLESQLKELAERLGPERMEILAVAPHEEMPDIYGRMDVLALPSRSGRYWKEQFGRVLVEAMASGVALAASDSGAIPEVVGPAGLIFPEGNAKELARCLDKLRDPELRGSFAKQGMARAGEKFSWRAWARDTVDLLEDLMAGRAGKRMVR